MLQQWCWVPAPDCWCNSPVWGYCSSTDSSGNHYSGALSNKSLGACAPVFHLLLYYSLASLCFFKDLNSSLTLCTELFCRPCSSSFCLCLCWLESGHLSLAVCLSYLSGTIQCKMVEFVPQLLVVERWKQKQYTLALDKESFNFMHLICWWPHVDRTLGWFPWAISSMSEYYRTDQKPKRK